MSVTLSGEGAVVDGEMVHCGQPIRAQHAPESCVPIHLRLPASMMILHHFIFEQVLQIAVLGNENLA